MEEFETATLWEPEPAPSPMLTTEPVLARAPMPASEPEPVVRPRPGYAWEPEPGDPRVGWLDEDDREAPKVWELPDLTEPPYRTATDPDRDVDPYAVPQVTVNRRASSR